MLEAILIGSAVLLSAGGFVVFKRYQKRKAVQQAVEAAAAAAAAQKAQLRAAIRPYRL